jgi:hypothetical protein
MYVVNGVPHDDDVNLQALLYKNKHNPTLTISVIRDDETTFFCRRPGNVVLISLNEPYDYKRKWFREVLQDIRKYYLNPGLQYPELYINFDPISDGKALSELDNLKLGRITDIDVSICADNSGSIRISYKE